MRIWYQSFSVGGADPNAAYPRIMRQTLGELLDSSTEITFGSMRKTVSAGHHFRSIQAFDIPELLRNLFEAEKAGYDAVIIGNSLDPGFHEARQLLRIPVLSIGHAALTYSQQVATKVLMVVSGRQAVGLVRENVRRYGLTHQVSDIVAAASDLSVRDMLDAFEDAALRERVITSFLDGVAQHLTDDVEAVLPMAGILQVLLRFAGITEIEGRPIVPGYLVAGPMAQMAAKLHKVGISTSSHGQYAPLPDALQQELSRVWPEYYALDGGTKA